MEQLCAECDTIDEFLAVLKIRANVFQEKHLDPGVIRQVSIGSSALLRPLSPTFAVGVPLRKLYTA